MYTITRKQSFEYAHRLMEHSGKCQYLHGHTGVAIVTMKAEKLSEQQHMVMDFAELKEAMNELLDQWDHATILHVNDPLAQLLHEAGQRVYSLNTHPTAEQLAHCFYVFLEKKFPGWVDSVTIAETGNNTATFRR